ncbi:MAG: sulfotransferase family 2 domain-containing protein [Flavobacteriales bacterium]
MKHPQLGRSFSPHSFHFKGREDVIFVHIKKTGGTSIRRTLPFEEIDIARSLKHYTVRHIIRSVGRSAWDKAFTFSFVRNPWTRLASLFRYLQRENNHTVEGLDFRAFVFQVMERNLIGWPLNLPPGLPQVDWLRDDLGQIKLSFVGHQETLTQDILTLASQLNLSTIDLPHLNQTKSLNMQDTLDLYSPEMKSMMLALYEEDFDTFGYPLGVVDYHRIDRPSLRQKLADDRGPEVRTSDGFLVRVPGVPWPFEVTAPPAVPMYQHFQAASEERWQESQKKILVCHPVLRLHRLRNRLIQWAEASDLLSALQKLQESRRMVKPLVHFLRPQSEWAFGIFGEFATAPGLRIERFEDVPGQGTRSCTKHFSREELELIDDIYESDFVQFGYAFGTKVCKKF